MLAPECVVLCRRKKARFFGVTPYFRLLPTAFHQTAAKSVARDKRLHGLFLYLILLFSRLVCKFSKFNIVFSGLQHFPHLESANYSSENQPEKI